MTQQVNIDDWQVNCNKVKKRTMHLYTSREWSDCRFHFQGQKATSEPGASGAATIVNAHKLILAMSSPVFAAQFYGNLSCQDPIVITDIERSTFLIMLRYIYTDHIEVYSMEIALDVYYAAKKYLLRYLQDECITVILGHLSTHNVCNVYEFACFHDEEELKQKCLKIFSKKTMDVLKSRNFMRAKIDTVKHILSMSPLNITSEMDLFNGLLQYADNEVKNKYIAEEMASTLCGLFTKHSAKVTKVGKSGGKSTITVSSDTSSENESETENRPSVSSIVVQKNNTTVAEKPLNKMEIVRNTLRPCVQQIRFLTLTPQQFAESKQLELLLHKEEIMAIAMNIASKNTAVEMPEGFCKSLVPRNQDLTNHKGTLRFTVNNIELVRKFTSDVVCTQKIPWSVSVLYLVKRKSNLDEKQSYLKVIVDCLWEKSGPWNFATTFTVKMLNLIVNNKTFNLPVQKHLFTFSNEQKQASCMYRWFDASPQSGTKSSITIEVDIEPSFTVRPIKIKALGKK